MCVSYFFQFEPDRYLLVAESDGVKVSRGFHRCPRLLQVDPPFQVLRAVAAHHVVDVGVETLHQPVDEGLAPREVGGELGLEDGERTLFRRSQLDLARALEALVPMLEDAGPRLLLAMEKKESKGSRKNSLPPSAMWNRNLSPCEMPISPT